MPSPLLLLLSVAIIVCLSSLNLASAAGLSPSSAYPLYTDYTDLVTNTSTYVGPSQNVRFVPASVSTFGGTLNFNQGYSNIAGSVTASYSICFWWSQGYVQADGIIETDNQPALTFVGAGPANVGSFAIGVLDGGILFAGQGDITKIQTPLTQQTTYQIPDFRFNQYYHTCHSYDASTGLSSLYLNGGLVANTTVPLPNDQWQGGANSITLGGLTYVSDPAYIASMKCLAFFDGVIPPYQAGSMFIFQLELGCDTLLSYTDLHRYDPPYTALSLASDYNSLVYPNGARFYSGPQQSASFIPNAGRLSDGALLFTQGYTNVLAPLRFDYSICFWFQANAAQGDGYPLTFVGANPPTPTTSSSTTYGGAAVGLIDGGLLFSGRGHSDSIPRQYPSQSSYQIPSFTLGQWYHVCTTYSQTTGVSTIYLNGQLVANDTVPLPANQVIYSWGQTTLGGLQYESNPTVNAAMQCLGVWTSEISAEQVSVVYNNQLTSSCNSGASFYYGPSSV